MPFDPYAGIPHLPTPDSGLDLLREGYAFASRRCEQLGTAAFRARVLGVPVVFMRGREATRLFYASGLFTRRGAVPPFVKHLLQDDGSVQALDDAAHHHRKAMFRGLLGGPEAVGRIREMFIEEWQRAVRLWSGQDRIELHRHAQVVLTRTALRFTGVRLNEADVRRRAQDLAAMVDRVALVGPPNWWARLRRRGTEAWAADLVERTRAGELSPPPESPLAVIAAHAEPDGRPLSPQVAAVELINVLRPTVAISRFLAFAAVALIEHPAWYEEFAAGKEADLEGFVHEVRRRYPFFPAVPGRARETFAWHGEEVAAGALVILDLYGTNHDPALWDRPEAFVPERFRDWDGDPDTLIPQGGGDVATGHRCPGENITIELMKETVRQLTRGMQYRVPVQDLSIALNRPPALPREGVLLSDVAVV
ncbi:cytochrome P450 [Georgenia deserti]|uniref:Cytochrome P450 n=1 Tax=Georgenia deserti TaxID=2093781 RepID=A0ABW4L4L5_9MICO